MNMMKWKIGVVLILLILFLPIVANAQMPEIPEPYYINLHKYGTGSIEDLEVIINFSWTRPEEKRVFDCSEMSAYMEWYLENHGFDTVIYTNSTQEHAWVVARGVWVEERGPDFITFIPVQYNVAIECTPPIPRIATSSSYHYPEIMYEDIYEAMEGEHPWEFDWWNILPEIANTEVTSWKVYDDNGYPTLLVKLHTNVDCKYRLLDPDGLKVSSGYITKEDLATKLWMGKYQTTPKAGKYTLTVYRADLSGTKIAEKVFEFNGAKISIESIDPEFEEGYKDYRMDDVRVIFENKGDLPAYIEKVVVTVDGKRDCSLYESVSIDPMSESVADISSGIYISGIEPGDKKVTVEGMCGRKIVVRGSKEVHLEKISIPGFEIIFAIAGLLAVAYLLRRKTWKKR